MHMYIYTATKKTSCSTRKGPVGVLCGQNRNEHVHIFDLRITSLMDVQPRVPRQTRWDEIADDPRLAYACMYVHKVLWAQYAQVQAHLWLLWLQ